MPLLRSLADATGWDFCCNGLGFLLQRVGISVALSLDGTEVVGICRDGDGIVHLPRSTILGFVDILDHPIKRFLIPDPADTASLSPPIGSILTRVFI